MRDERSPRCEACARVLKASHVVRGGRPVVLLVCKSPICRLYNRDVGK